MKTFAIIATVVAAVAAEADPAYLAAGYGYGLGYAAPIASPLLAGRIWKREAEAEPEADPAYLAAGLGYAGLGYAGIGYAAPIAVAKSAPCVNAANIPVPCNGAALIAGRIWKREAEAEPEADPAYLAAGYGLGYSTLGLGYAGLGYAGLGYSAPLAYSGYAASPCSLDASGSVRPRLRLRLTPPTWLPATDLATLVSVMPVSAMPVLATPTLAMPPLPTGTTCGNFGKFKVFLFDDINNKDAKICMSYLL